MKKILLAVSLMCLSLSCIFAMTNKQQATSNSQLQVVVQNQTQNFNIGIALNSGGKQKIKANGGSYTFPNVDVKRTMGDTITIDCEGGIEIPVDIIDPVNHRTKTVTIHEIKLQRLLCSWFMDTKKILPLWDKKNEGIFVHADGLSKSSDVLPTKINLIFTQVGIPPHQKGSEASYEINI